MTEKRSSQHCLSDLSLRSSACARPPQRHLSGEDVLSFEPYSTWEGKDYRRLHGTLPAIVSVWRTLEEGTVPPLKKRFSILKSCASSLPFFFFWQSFEMRGESTLEARLGREREAILWGEASRGPPRQARVLAGGYEPFNIIKRNSKLWPQTFFVQWLFTWVRVSGLENTKSPSLQEQTVNTQISIIQFVSK